MTTKHYPVLVAREPADGRGWLIEADTPEGEAQLTYDGDMRHTLAHLLCAAPDLLAACEALDGIEAVRGVYAVPLADMQRIRSAIARAMGGAS
jgi:hypothetical protein